MVFGCRNSLVEEKRRLEARVAQLEEEMDEEHVELEQTTEKARKSAAQVHVLQGIGRSYCSVECCMYEFHGPSFQSISRQSYDSLRNFVNCTLILRHIYDSANF